MNIAQSACDSVSSSSCPLPQATDCILIIDQVDRQIRLLNQSIEEVEAFTASTSHPDSQPRRILSYAVTGRWLRPQIGPSLQPLDNQFSTHESQTIELSIPNRAHGKTSVTSIRKIKKGKKRKNVHGQRVLQQPGTSTAVDVVVHEPDPNEPRYCYCNNVSYGAVRVVSVSVFLKLRVYCRWYNVKTPQNVHMIG